MASVTGSAVAGIAAVGAFDYNRGNYLFDASLRFRRYTSGYQFALEQAAQYREDIRDFTELTVSKQDIYTIIGTIFLMLSFQIILAGRLGIYGPAPPGWMMGLYFGNISISLMFVVVMIWLSIHASARAAAGSASMLTRSVRLPIPSPKQLDGARKTGNAFEKQRIRDTFRVPFIAPAAKDTAVVEKGEQKRRMPRWFQDEQRELGGKGSGSAGPGVTPEHFELYRGLQEEWWCHECYVRIGAFFFMTHWLMAMALYTQCHCFAELRALWPAWSITPLFCAAMWILQQVEILPGNRTYSASIPLEKLHPFMPLVSCFAMSWEYSSIQAGGGWRALIYVLNWLCYVSQFLWMVKLYDLAQPVEQGEHPDVPGRAWWPQSWTVPPAFNGNIYLLAPPKSVERDHICLQLEMKLGREPQTAGPKQQREVSPQVFAWKIFRAAIIIAVAIWLFIIAGRIWEECYGERALLKEEGRQIRWPAHAQPGVSPWTRLGSRGEMAHAGGADRRLTRFWAYAAEKTQAAQATKRAKPVVQVATRLTSMLGPLAATLGSKHQQQHQVGQPATGSAPRPAAVTWPAGFVPSILVSQSGSLLIALAPNQIGTIIDLAGDGKSSLHTFALRGIDELGALLGATWTGTSLVVTTLSGAVAECSVSESGSWLCHQLGFPLQTGSSIVTAAVAARVPSSNALRAAITFADEAVVALYETQGNEWFPTGEIEVHRSGGPIQMSYSETADELLLSSRDGISMKWNLGAAEPAIMAAPQPSAAAWLSACSLSDGRVARLAARPAGPELLLFGAL